VSEAYSVGPGGSKLPEWLRKLLVVLLGWLLSELTKGE